MKLCKIEYIVILVFILIGCERDIYEQGSLLFKENLCKNSSFILPVNLEEYNRLVNTKSLQGSYYDFDLTQFVLDSANSYQKEVKPGVVYTEIPLKSSLVCKTESKYFGENSNNENLVPAKMFYVKKEFCLKDSIKERIVILIPTCEYYEKVSSYSYLNMPNFSGTMITASLKGVLIDVWGVKDGYIGFGEFLKDDSCPIFATLGFFEAHSTSISKGATKSHNMDDTLDVCRVVASYTIKNNIFPYFDRDFIFSPTHTEEQTPELQYPGGVKLDKDEDSTYFTATVMSKFCGEETISNKLYCIAGTEVCFDAKSSANDSCVFFCWKSGVAPISYSPKLIQIMDKDYAFTTIFQSIENKDCYDLAKIVTDTIWSAKVDSLWTNTSKTKKESGMARRESGSYYQLTEGDKGSIRLNLESNTKYTNIDHTHPRNNCIVSGADICKILNNLNKFPPKNMFSFSVITKNEIMLLKLDGIDNTLKYLTNIKRDYGNEYAEEYFDTYHIFPTLEKMNKTANSNRHIICLQEMLPLLSSMGFKVSYCIKDMGNQQASWYNTYLNSECEVVMDRCF